MPATYDGKAAKVPRLSPHRPVLAILLRSALEQIYRLGTISGLEYPEAVVP
jgi:hypothetical protein